MDPRDAGALDLSAPAPGTGTSDEFLALMNREWERIKAEQEHPQYLPCRSEAEAAWFLAKWGPVPDAPR